MLNRRRVRLRPSQRQIKHVLLKTASVLLQDERYKVPIDEVAPQPKSAQPRRT